MQVNIHSYNEEGIITMSSTCDSEHIILDPLNSRIYVGDADRLTQRIDLNTKCLVPREAANV